MALSGYIPADDLERLPLPPARLGPSGMLREEAMRRAIVFLLLLAAGPAWSGWVQTSSEDVNSVMYADPDTIKINGQLRQIVELHDFKAQDKTRGNRSTRVLSEYDCKDGRIRILQEEYFSGQMGSGERLGGFTGPSDWFYIAPGTRGGTLLKFVCSR